MFKVEKRDGSLQDFDKSKISSALVRVGLTPEEAQGVADRVEAWASTAAVDGVVKSADIRNQVLGLITPEAAGKYKSFAAAKPR